MNVEPCTSASFPLSKVLNCVKIILTKKKQSTEYLFWFTYVVTAIIKN